MHVLIVGGAGYIGSHVAAECIHRGHDVVVFDDLSEGCLESLEALGFVAGGASSTENPRLHFIEGTVHDRLGLRDLFEQRDFDVVIQLAGNPSSARASRDAARHFNLEVGGTLGLVDEMLRAGCHRLVYASSAKVYGDPGPDPVAEDAAVDARESLGRAKLVVEQTLEQIAATQPLHAMILRLFTVSGASSTGGEHRSEDVRLIPSICQASCGQRAFLRIHGTDHPTPDGSAVRDYVHVKDVAEAFVLAAEATEGPVFEKINVGSGVGHSVLRVIQESQRHLELPISVVHTGRHPFQASTLVACNERARALLGWEPRRSDLANIVGSAAAWHRENPEGYRPTPGDLAVQESESFALFGEIAVRLGHVSEGEVVRALECQQEGLSRGQRHQLLGMHMLELGMLSTSQLIDVLRYYEELRSR